MKMHSEWKSNEPYYITLKLEPSEGDFLRQQYEDIIPGYFLKKEDTITLRELFIDVQK